MKIACKKNVFEWESSDRIIMVSEELHGPYCCCYEEIKVIREGDCFDMGAIHSIGTHGAYDGFTGFKKISNEGPFSKITPSLFQTGDLLLIEKLPENITELEYWKGMTT